MKWIKSIIRSLLIAFVAPVVMASGIVAQEPGLPGTVISVNRLFATGNTIFLQFLGGFAGYDIDLLLFDFVGQSPSGLPVIFNNHTSTVGDKYEVSGFTPGQELIFGIFVQNTQITYYTGPPEGNPDHTLHVQFFETGDAFYTIGMGFEDLYGGGDEDFQDVFFQVGGGVTVNPEPVTLLLLASGLFGLAGAGLVGRRHGRLRPRSGARGAEPDSEL